jgi:hypothetical protein
MIKLNKLNDTYKTLCRGEKIVSWNVLLTKYIKVNLKDIS